MQLRHLGHSCLLVDVAGHRLLIDPGGFSDVEGVRDLTAVLVTHLHPDHLDPAVIPGLLTDNPGVELWLEDGAAEALLGSEPQLDERVRRMRSGAALQFGPVTVTPVGDQHAVIHEYVPRPGNLGLVINAEDEPTLYHPGDALDAADPTLADVDILCVPINAPWAKIADTLAFVRRIAPARVVPIHDGLLNDSGRSMYLGHVANFGADGGLEVLDLQEQGTVPV